MYSQVQVPIPMHGNTIECVAKINFVFVILAWWFWKKDNNELTITYLTDYNTIKKFPVPIQIPGIGAAVEKSKRHARVYFLAFDNNEYGY